MEYEGKKTALSMKERKQHRKNTCVRDVIRRQQDLNDLCRRNTQQAHFRQKRRFPLAVGDSIKRTCQRIHLGVEWMQGG